MRDTYENSTMSCQTLRVNAARFRKDNSLLSLLKVRDGNDVKPEAIHIRAIEPVRSQKTLKRVKTMRKKSWKIHGKYQQRGK